MKKHAFAYLNFTQFLGVVNDNFFKLTLIFMLLQVQGFENNQTILALAGAIFVVPFLLFSIPAGTLADRYSKSTITKIIKLLELFAAILGVIGFALKDSLLSYTALFLFATSGAFFGPAKYGIVPELVTNEKLSKSNSYLSSFTYLAMIIGTVIAGPITQYLNKNFFYISLFSLLFAIIGLIFSLFIPKTIPAGSEKKFSLLFITQIVRTLKKTVNYKHLTSSIFGSAYFLFIGGYVQLNIIPYAVECLKLSDIQASYLFLVTAVGIGSGSLICGKISGSKIELGLTPFGALGITICSLIIGLCDLNLTFVVLLLFLIGFFGGLYLIPVDTFIQAASPKIERGQNIACNNFMGFFGVLIASFLIYAQGEILKLSSKDGFIIVGLITFLVTIYYFISFKNPIRNLFLRTTQEIKKE
jgi:acyl-[acyl-carrier-protein]-phospholipid O-acyltransferase/long-chain-fatty-acid--[acyl-carrier-protein] ligase